VVRNHIALKLAQKINTAPSGNWEKIVN